MNEVEIIESEVCGSVKSVHSKDSVAQFDNRLIMQPNTGNYKLYTSTK